MLQRDRSQACSIQKFLFLIATFLMFVHCAAQAKEPTYPVGCKASGFAFKDGKLVLKQETAQATHTVYFIHNVGEKSLALRYIKDPKAFMSPDWNVEFGADRWAAFATDKDSLTFKCKANDQKVDCQEVLQLCQFAKAKFATSNMGDYWVATNQTQSAAMKAANAKGIILR